MLSLSDFDFALPTELIAQSAPLERSRSRLLQVVPGPSFALVDRVFADLPACLCAGDLLIFNDTRVIKARLHGYKATGGAVEVLIERVLTERTALCQIRASKAPQPGSRLRLGIKTQGDTGGVEVGVGERVGNFFTLIFPDDVLESIEQYGHLPLPPYIARAPHAIDEQRYQTVYARSPGAVAAPTAGLHFDQALLEQLAAAQIQTSFLTLHVGAGTFTPVRTENLAEHRMHTERYHLSADLLAAIDATRQRGGRVVAVGTTTLRALEACAQQHQGILQTGHAQTNIFITPGFRFQVVDMLITNFHLPKSTLLMLVSAFAGYQTIRQAYSHAIAQSYRFFSYGDAMLLTRNSENAI